MNIISQIPNNFETNIIRNPFIRVKISEPLDRSTINSYTVILVESDTQDIIEGVADYIVGTGTVTFQLYDLLKPDTNYTCILVGSVNGIFLLSPSEPFSPVNYVFTFTTGTTIDNTLPLANRAMYEDGPYFQGEKGIYKETFSRTGETVSHIVTTAAQVGPDGKIYPAPYGPDIYLDPSGMPAPYYDALVLSYSTPENGEVNVTSSGIYFVFNNNLSVIDSWDVAVTDMLENIVTAENEHSNYTVSASGTTIGIHSTLGNFRYASTYEFTLYNVVDVHSQSLAEVKVTFKTKIVPFYSTVKIIRTNLGSLISKETDEDIQTVIYENSLWIFQNASPTFIIDAPPNTALEYVTCKSKLDMLYRVFFNGGPATKKTLADFTVDYGSQFTNVIQKRIDALETCAQKNLNLITIGVPSVAAGSAVKASADPRKPTWKRLEDATFTKTETGV